MLDRNRVVEKCVQLIDQNYYFKNNQRSEWERNKNRIFTEIESIDSEEEVLEVLNHYICELHDPHTKLIFAYRPQHIINESICFDHKVLFLYIANQYKKIISINDIPVSLVLDDYKINFDNYPLALIEEEIIKDIQFLRNVFKGNSITLKLESGEIKCLYPINFNQWYENMSIMSGIHSFEPIYVERVDCDTICVKIVSFRFRNLYCMMKEKLMRYNNCFSSVIFDVRNNMGGYVDETKKIVGSIIKKPVKLDYSISCIKLGNRDVSECIITPGNECLFENKRIFVFTNYRTMSAAEYIFAKSMQINGGCIVGEETAGFKDQAEVFNINQTVELQITTKRFLKCGKYLDEKIVPDVCINFSSLYNKNEDPYILWYKKINKHMIN